MDIFINNFLFIAINSGLALAAILLGWIMLKAKSSLLKLVAGFLWLIFLPNTIYILTDISHLFEQWSSVDAIFKLLLVLQYSIFLIFGIVTFVIATYFLQKLLDGKRKEIKAETAVVIFMLNFVVGFGVILGNIERTNSWYVFTDPARVVRNIITLISSSELLILTFGVGILANIIYFLALQTLASWGRKLFKGGR